MQIIQEKSPNAVKEKDSENLIVVIDNIDKPVFAYLQECLNKIHKRKYFKRQQTTEGEVSN